MTTAQPSRLIALRLYFSAGTRANRTRFWHHLSAPVLAQHLMSAARQDGIEQALLHPIRSGYLPGGRMSHHAMDGTDMRHPQCLELLDTEPRLRAFMAKHRQELQKVRAVLFVCEEPMGPAPASHP